MPACHSMITCHLTSFHLSLLPGLMPGSQQWMMKGSYIISLYTYSFRICVKGNLDVGQPFSSWHDSGVECDKTSKDQSAHHPWRIVVLKLILWRLTMLRDRMIAMEMKWYNSSLVKDQLGMMPKQMVKQWQDVKSTQPFNHIPMTIHIVKDTTICQTSRL